MKSINVYFSIFIIFVNVLLLSCNKETIQDSIEIDDTYILLDSTIISDGLIFSDSQGEEYIKFKTNSTWILEISDTLENTQPWCYASEYHGNPGEVLIKISVERNEQYNDRNSIITIEAGNVKKKFTVLQKQKNAMILSANQIEVEGIGGIISIEAKTNINYTVKIDESSKEWISEIVTKSLSSYNHTFKIAENFYAKREGTIIFSSQEKEYVVRIFQKGKNSISIHQNIAGDLHKSLKNYDNNDILNLKISGTINNDDITYINTYLTNLEVLDISETDLEIIREGLLNVKTILLPKSLRIIKEYSFEGASLEELLIPANVEIIEIGAFAGCNSLIKVQFEKNSKITNIDGGFYGFSSNPDGVFRECKQLREIVIPKSVTIIKGGAFHGCVSLESVIFEDGSNLQELEGVYKYDGARGAFMGCISLKNIEIPKCVKRIGFCAFKGCTSLTNVIFENDSNLEFIDGAFFPDHLESYGAFEDCVSLKEILLPSQLKEIGYSAFKNCSSLEYVYFEPNSKLKIINGAQGGSFNVPASYNESFGAFSNCTSLKKIEVPSSVEVIGEAVFKNCVSLESVVFDENSRLKVLEGDYNVKGYYTGVFADCKSLKSIVIPANVQIIKKTAFKGCISLETVSFEKNSCLEEIIGGDEYTEYGAFNNCKKLNMFDASNCSKLKNIGNSSFYGNESLKLVKLGTEISPQIGNKAFYGINKFAVLKIPTGSVSNYLFLQNIFYKIEEF